MSDDCFVSVDPATVKGYKVEMTPCFWRCDWCGHLNDQTVTECLCGADS